MCACVGASMAVDMDMYVHVGVHRACVCVQASRNVRGVGLGIRRGRSR